MIIVNGSGDYERVEGTLTLKKSEHPAYQAAIEIRLGQGQWIGAPANGHLLKQFDTRRMSEAQKDAYRKQLSFYLRKYSPQIRTEIIARFIANSEVRIAEDAFNA